MFFYLVDHRFYQAILENHGTFFLKIIAIRNPKFFINSIVYHLFFFILFAFFTSFFLISPIQTCQKILNIFVVLYNTNYRFYQRILENSWIFIKKNIYILNTKHFQNCIVLLFAFWFFSIFDIFFSILLVYSCQKKFKIFVLFYCMDPRFYEKILQTYEFIFQKFWDI